jgi:hypothetical protein
MQLVSPWNSTELKPKINHWRINVAIATELADGRYFERQHTKIKGTIIS